MQLEQSLAGISSPFDETRRLACLEVFDMLSLRAEDVDHICLVNFLVGFEERWQGCAALGVWNSNMIS
jgi:hypothetical protein